MTSFLKSILIAIRPKTLSASIAPVLVGSSIAFNSSHFNMQIFFLTFISAIFIQIGTNFANDVYDFINGADNDERIGPTRAVQANLISVSAMKNLTIISLEDAITERPNLALFSAGGSVALEWAPRFVEVGATVIDNSSAWRMDPTKKLVVPEINAHTLTPEDKIIANPNCSTIQMVVVLNPLHQKYKIKLLL